jgi:hypothetical protein
MLLMAMDFAKKELGRVKKKAAYNSYDERQECAKSTKIPDVTIGVVVLFFRPVWYVHKI